MRKNVCRHRTINRNVMNTERIVVSVSEHVTIYLVLIPELRLCELNIMGTRDRRPGLFPKQSKEQALCIITFCLSNVDMFILVSYRHSIICLLATSRASVRAVSPVGAPSV